MINHSLLKCLYERASVRSFTDQEVSPDTLRTIIDAGCHGATYKPIQSLKSVVRKKKKP